MDISFAWFDTCASLCAVIGDFNDPHKQVFHHGHSDNVSCIALSPSVYFYRDITVSEKFPSRNRANSLPLARLDLLQM